MPIEAGTEAVVVASSGVDGQTVVGAPGRISWGAIFAGAVAALSVWILLYTLGLALGLSTVEADDPGSVRSSGLFTGIFGLVAPLVALFVGGVVAGRTAGVLDTGTGTLHGLVMWGVTTLLGAWLVMTLLTGVIGGVASAGKSAIGAAAGAVGQAASGTDLKGAPAALGIDAEDALRPVNQRLAAAGKPQVTAAQLQATVKDVVQDGLRQGRVDRQLLVQSVAQNTALSPADAEEVATRLEGQVQQARSEASTRLDSAAQQVQTGALKAADATGKAFWGVFGALLLGMIAAIVGAGVGAKQGRKRHAARVHERPGLGALREQRGEG